MNSDVSNTKKKKKNGKTKATGNAGQNRLNGITAGNFNAPLRIGQFWGTQNMCVCRQSMLQWTLTVI